MKIGFQKPVLMGWMIVGLFCVIPDSRGIVVDIPTVTIEAIDADASEVGPNTGTFRITRSGGDLSCDLWVYFEQPVGGTAQSGTDYQPLPQYVGLPGFGMYVDVTVTPILDLNSEEGNETVVLTLATNANYWLGWPSSATVTIHDVPADSDSDDLSDAWEWWHFGDLDQAGGDDYDGDGAADGSEFGAGTDPNTIVFSFSSVSRHVNSNNVPATIKLSRGVPSQMAVLVNNTNFASATWNSFSSNFTANLGSTDGVYTVWVGLKGRSDSSAQSWERGHITLDRVAPTITITNPPSGTTSRPILQLRGYSSEPLAAIYFDVTNAMGLITNQQGFVTQQEFDTNLLAATVNYFQCFDIGLTNGTNTVTLRMSDRAGNMRTTNVSLTLDYSGDTNGPAITLIWPPPGACLAGDHFTLRGLLDDETAEVTAQIVDPNGTTNVLNGLVERNRQFWVDDLPLTNGVNAITLVATDAAGNNISTNFFVTNSAVQLEISPVSESYLNQSSVLVSGTVTPGYSVLVNGMGTTVDEGGYWVTTNNAPVRGNGTATFDAAAYGPGGGPPVLTSLLEEKPPFIYVEQHSDRYDYSGSQPAVGETNQRETTYSQNWGDDGQHTFSGVQVGNAQDCVQTNCEWYNQTFTWSDSDPFGMTYFDIGMVGIYSTNGSYAGPPESDMPYRGYVPATTGWDTFTTGNAWVTHFFSDVGASYAGKQYTRQSQTQLKLKTGGRAGSKRKNLIVIQGGGGAYEHDERVRGNLWSGPPEGIDLSQVQLNGKNLGADGRFYIVLPDNEPFTIDVTAPPSHYNLNFTPTKHKLVSETDCFPPTKRDRTELGVGELVFCSIQPPLSADWSVTGGGSLSGTNGPGVYFTASKSPSTSTVKAKIGSAEPLTITFNVIPPDSIMVITNWDVPLGTQDANGSQIGARTDYQWVMGPTNVSFHGIELRENCPTNYFLWPNGTNKLYAPEPAHLGWLDCNNSGGDRIADLYPKNLLWNGTNYDNFSFSYTYFYQYKNQAGVWTNCITLTTTTTFHGGDKQCQQTFQGVSGGWQGPWQ